MQIIKPKISENQNKQQDFFKVQLVTFINMHHELVRLADTMDWEVFCNKFGSSFNERQGSLDLPTRLMVGLTYLKYLFDLSDEEMLTRFICDPYVQF